MTAATQNFIIKANEDWQTTWTLKNNGVAMDITGFDFKLTVRAEKGANTYKFLELIVNDGIIITDAVAGEIQVSIPVNATIATRKICFYDLIGFNGSKSIVLVQGTMTFDPGVTYWVD